MITDLNTLYDAACEDGSITLDVMQKDLVSRLNLLKIVLENSAHKKSLLQKLIKKDDPPNGLYIYGPVGRGKSYVMDLFFEHIQITKKRRVHFHAFMLSVHSFIHDNKKQFGLNEALPKFAKEIAKDSTLLCFDEFHVTDVADAMILKTLFEHLWRENVVVVSTSNWAPDDLYKNGLQRDRFLKFIDLIKDKMGVFSLHGDTDYREEKIRASKRYFWPCDVDAIREMDGIFDALTDGKEIKSETHRVKGHDLYVPKAGGAVAWFNYTDLITQNFAAVDFMKLTEIYTTIFLYDVPKISPDARDEAKRLMVFIDTCYEAQTRLIIGAASKAEKIYAGGALKFEFDRTISRLKEMQSVDYGS